ncbi:MAG TPA: lysine 2,3-aminomutase [Candidatus Limnocylindrales bacterium]|nr:lysine 2,3-aminomutase [Candidatus Limnocylindrales bacterium]
MPPDPVIAPAGAVGRPADRDAGRPEVEGGDFVNLRDPARRLGPDGKPARSPRAPKWQDVPDAQWDDWRWQLSHRVNTVDEIGEILELTEEEREGLSAPDKFRVDITPYFISLIDPKDPNDPIRKQVIPLGREHRAFTGMMEDSLAEDRHSPVPGLVHRYPDRVLMLVTTQCASYCRFCTRSRIVGDPTQNFNRREHEAQLDYIRRTPQIRDVLISGGDGLTLAPKLLESVIRGLREIPHVEIIRIGSRVPVFLPQRIDDELCAMLSRYHPIWMNIHVNHPNEITPELARACDRLTRAGIPLGNQSVLLAGVNDCVHIQRELVHRLVEIRVRPYYLYQCDLVEGSGHFRTPVGKGIEIVEGLRGHTSGYAVPTYVIDAPGGGGKIPVMPNYLISYSDHKVVLRNYEGYITTYEEPLDYQPHDRSSCRFCRHPRPEPGQTGVSGLLEGERMWIEPRGFEEVHARGRQAPHRLTDPAKWQPYGVGAIEGRATETTRLPVLEAGDARVGATESGRAHGPASEVPGRSARAAGSAPGSPERVYGPGEEPRPPEGAPTATANHELL